MNFEDESLVIGRGRMIMIPEEQNKTLTPSSIDLIPV
jgi:hypothetical protein